MESAHTSPKLKAAQKRSLTALLSCMSSKRCKERSQTHTHGEIPAHITFRSFKASKARPNQRKGHAYLKFLASVPNTITELKACHCFDTRKNKSNSPTMRHTESNPRLASYPPGHLGARGECGMPRLKNSLSQNRHRFLPPHAVAA